MRAEDNVDARLDHALEMTFPASDPFTVYTPAIEPHRAAAPASPESEVRIAA